MLLRDHNDGQEKTKGSVTVLISQNQHCMLDMFLFGSCIIACTITTIFWKGY